MGRNNWTSEKLFNRLLKNKTQVTYWENIAELRRRPSKEVFEKAYGFAKSNIDKHKIIGLDVLQQLGFNPRFNKEQMVELHFELLEKEQSKNVLTSIFHGIGHNNDDLSPEQIAKLIQFKNIDSIHVKHALISALSGVDNLKAVETLIHLSKDKTPSVRNWATFAIGSLTELDNEHIRNALWERINDKDFDTKSEAIAGLANRNDQRVKTVIISELENGDYGTLLFKAILTVKDQSFLPVLDRSLKITKTSKDPNENGWVAALESLISELKKR